MAVYNEKELVYTKVIHLSKDIVLSVNSEIEYFIAFVESKGEDVVYVNYDINYISEESITKAVLTVKLRVAD